MTDKRKKIVTACLIALFVMAMVAATVMLGKPIKNLVSEPERIREWVDARGAWGRVLFVGVVVLQLVVAVIPGEPLEIAAGYAFGALEGTLLCLLGAVIGSALVFSFVRKLGVKALEVFFSREKIDSIKFLNNTEKLNMIVFIVFLIPGTPKDILCYGVGLTKMRFATWMLITLVARIPSIITSTIGGDALGTGDFAFAAIVFGVTIVVSVTGLLCYKRLRAARERMAKRRAERKLNRVITRAEKKQQKYKSRERARTRRSVVGPHAWRVKSRASRDSNAGRRKGVKRPPSLN